MGNVSPPRPSPKGCGEEILEEAAVLPHPREPSLAPRGSGHESRAVTRPGGDDAAGRAGHSWPLPARSPTPLAWVTAPAKLPDTETPRGLRVSGTIHPLMGSDSSAPPPSALSLHRFSPRALLSAQPAHGSPAACLARQVAPGIPLRGVGFGQESRSGPMARWLRIWRQKEWRKRCLEAQLVSVCSAPVPEEKDWKEPEKRVDPFPGVA